jgi:hypothetical protein
VPTRGFAKLALLLLNQLCRHCYYKASRFWPALPPYPFPLDKKEGGNQPQATRTNFVSKKQAKNKFF